MKQDINVKDTIRYKVWHSISGYRTPPSLRESLWEHIYLRFYADEFCPLFDHTNVLVCLRSSLRDK
jgi:hypothetical protein